MWSSLFRYLVLSSELSIPYDRAVEDWMRVQRRSFSRSEMAPIGHMLEQLRSGLPLFECIRCRPGVFPRVVRYFLLLAPNETILPEFLRTAGVILEKHALKVRTLLTAIEYPVTILLVASLVTSVYRIKVLPTFTAILGSLGRDLPLTLRIQGFLVHYASLGFVIAAFVLVLCFLLWVFAGPLAEAVVLRIPMIGDRILMQERARLLSGLTLMINAPIPWIEAMDRVSSLLRWKACRREWMQFVERLRLGDRWQDSAEKLHFVSSDVAYVLKILPQAPNEAGHLLQATSKFYWARSEEVSQLSFRLIEPILILFVGFWIAFIVYSLYRPLTMLAPLIQ